MSPLIRLLNDNRAVKDPARRFEVVRNEANPKEATVYLYDFIVSSAADAEWYGGVDAETFVKNLAALDAEVIHLRINSPGGDVFAARAMEQAVRAHPANVIAHIDGYAASAATYVALAAREVEISDGGFFMIHNSWTIAVGNSKDFRKTADLLDQLDTTIVNTYAKRTGLGEAELRAMLDEETWINATDAVEYGFADRIADGEVKAVNWNLSSLLARNAKTAHDKLDNSRREREADKSNQEKEPQEASAREREHAERIMQHMERIAA